MIDEWRYARREARIAIKEIHMPPILPLTVVTKEAFLTGSYAYGTPTEKSDIDLVVYMPDFRQVSKLLELQDREVKDYPNRQDCYCIRFDKLNLLVCLTEEAYNEWLIGTKKLLQRKPVTREEAKKVFKRIRSGNPDPDPYT